MSNYSVFNVQGLCPQTKLTKVPYIRDILYDKNMNFICLTETWLSDNHLQAELDIEGYTIFRTDRQREKAKHGRLGGGVCLYVRDDLATTFKTVISYSNGVVDVHAIHSVVLELFIVVVYRQPDQMYGHRSNATHFKEGLGNVYAYLSSIKETQPNIVLCGDFNLPHGDWSGTAGTSTRSTVGDERKMIDTLIELSMNYGLSQCVSTSTHFQGNILDLFLLIMSTYVTISNVLMCQGKYLTIK